MGDITAKEAGRLGGQSLARKMAGTDFFKENGKKGGKVTSERYGPEHYKKAGSKGGLIIKAKYGSDFFRRIATKKRPDETKL